MPPNALPYNVFDDGSNHLIAFRISDNISYPLMSVGMGSRLNLFILNLMMSVSVTGKNNNSNAS